MPGDLARRVAAVSGLSNLAVAKAPINTTTPQQVKDACINDALGLIPGYSAFQAYLHQGQGGPQGLEDQVNDLLAVITFISIVLNNLFKFISVPYAVGHCVGYYLGYLSNNGRNNPFLTDATDAVQLDRLAEPRPDTTDAVAGLPISVTAPLVSGRGVHIPASGIKPIDVIQNLQKIVRAGAVRHSNDPIRLASAIVQPAGSPPPANAQKIGLLEFDTFHRSDVENWLNLLGANPAFASRLSEVHVNGGAGAPGAGESEVLIDIVAVMTADPSLNTSYVVYDAPASASFQQVFNAMINDGVTIISNSWSECEDQHTLADVQSIDSVLAQAAASGISVFNGTGDSGSTCLDGSPNTVGVPANSPHATAVGGTSPTFGPGLTYQGETWWNGSGQVPPSGQGGFGVSRFFPRPPYQNGFTGSTTRSVPDVAVVADPRAGVTICQADAGGCPTGLLYGGTSLAAPIMAGMVAFLNEALGSNIGEVNPVIYPLGGTDAFHTAASMSSDFAHVGLGSPNVSNLLAALSQYQIGPVDPSTSHAGGTLLPVADGTTSAIVRVNLTDANNFPVAGKTVSLTPNGGSHAIVSAPSGPSDGDGAVTFGVTDTTAEPVTFSVVADGITLATSPKLTFVTPPAASGGINAFPSSVAANGAAAATIVVTLQDSKGQGVPGKLVTLSQGGGHSVITAPTPAVTDSNGQIQFTATDNVGETVTYTAVDVTDVNLAVPGSASVTFTGAGTSCVGTRPTAAPGFTLTPFANGFVAQNFFFSGVNFIGCPGASNPTFDTTGSLFVADFANGNLYKFGLAGGAVSTANTLANLGLALNQAVFDKSGNLYVSRGATGAGPSSGDVSQIDPVTGAVLRTVATGVTCGSPLALDPLSGDLFFTDTCFGFAANPGLWRIRNPNSTTPTVTLYATLPATPNGAIAFSPDGTMYVVSSYNGTQSVVQLAGTNTPSPPAMTTLTGIASDFWITMGEVQSNGAAKSLLVHSAGVLNLVDITTNPFTTTPLINGVSTSSGTVGPDGCLYVSESDSIAKLTPANGQCGFAPTNPAPALGLAPGTVSPNPAQGTPVTFTATLQNVGQPQGTPIRFIVSGANSLVNMVAADSNGQASFTYTGVFTGNDTVVATATANATALNSNQTQVSWTSGQHSSFLTLNLSPTAGTLGTPSTVQASLTDISATPPAPIANAAVSFSLGDLSCAGVTDGDGIASCSVIPDQAGLATLSAAFQGTARFLGATASTRFATVALAVSSNGGGATPTKAMNFEFGRKGVADDSSVAAFYIALEPGQTLDTTNNNVVIDLSNAQCGGSFSRIVLPAGTLKPSGPARVHSFAGDVVDGVSGAREHVSVRFVPSGPNRVLVTVNYTRSKFACLEGTQHRSVHYSITVGDVPADTDVCFQRTALGTLYWPPRTKISCP